MYKRQHLISKAIISRIAVSVALFLMLALLLFITAVTASSEHVQRRGGLTVEERVAYQQAIERVYHAHRIWPSENRQPRPSLDEVMPPPAIEEKVRDYLKKSAALGQKYQQQITAEQLQAEIERMASHTRNPEVLKEIFAALDNDPFVVAECLARPDLADRFMRDSFATFEKHQLAGEQTFDEWWAAEREQVPYLMLQELSTKQGYEYRLAEVTGAASPCSDDTWNNTRSGPPAARALHTAVWTGSEMVIWGGLDRDGPRNTGGHYNPATDTWHPRTGYDLPDSRSNHTAVWTGTEMIIWGGFINASISLNTGSRYNSSTKTWTQTSLPAPSARYGHTALWTGSEMVIWGGYDSHNYLNTGGRYNPTTDVWAETSLLNAPAGRSIHDAVWTGTEMIIWGGNDGNVGGRYTPLTDAWQQTSPDNAPQERVESTAVWTGKEMIIWGGLAGDYLNTGGLYCAAGQAAGPRITSASVSGKKLLVNGQGFDAGARIYLDGEKQKTANDALNPFTKLKGKKAGKKIAPGQTVRLKVRNSDGTESPEFSYLRPA